MTQLTVNQTRPGRPLPKEPWLVPFMEALPLTTLAAMLPAFNAQ